jgi:DNA-directed RNA polymerase specialized sigma24 family protein
VTTSNLADTDVDDKPPIYYKKVVPDEVRVLAMEAAKRAKRRGWVDDEDEATSAATARALQSHVGAPWLASLKFLTLWLRWWGDVYRRGTARGGDEYVVDPRADSADPRKLIEARELLDTLPGHHREVIIRRFWLGESAGESAAALFITEAEFNARLRDALEAMRWAR